MKQHWYARHRTSGEIYAIEASDKWTITGVCGPLHYKDINPDYSHEYDVDDAEWAMNTPMRRLEDSELERLNPELFLPKEHVCHNSGK